MPKSTAAPAVRLIAPERETLPLIPVTSAGVTPNFVLEERFLAPTQKALTVVWSSTAV